MFENNTIAVLIPAYDEEGKIGTVVKRIRQSCSTFVDEIVVINDGSKDKTLEEARASGANVLNQEKNQGVGAALRRGMYYALEKNIDIVVVCICVDK